jgi:hypothetical protein
MPAVHPGKMYIFSVIVDYEMPMKCITTHSILLDYNCTSHVHKESLEYFGKRRTDLTVGKTFQGVETPSQVSCTEYTTYQTL